MTDFDLNTFGGGKADEHMIDALNRKENPRLRAKITKCISDYNITLAEILKLDNPYRNNIILMMKEKWLDRGEGIFNHHMLKQDDIIRSLYVNIITTMTRKYVDQGLVLEKLRGTKSMREVLRALENSKK